MNGIQEVRGSTPLSSTIANKGFDGNSKPSFVWGKTEFQPYFQPGRQKKGNLDFLKEVARERKSISDNIEARDQYLGELEG